jgi:AcrR family transcriptional regulator
MSYDAKATRERILAAATAEFAEFGVSGARVDRIAAEARANKRAIYDYFGDKEALFGAVLEDQMVNCAEEVRIEGGDIADYAERLFEYHTANPTTLRLLMWEALEFGDRPAPAEDVRAKKYRSRVEALIDTGLDEDAAAMLVFLTLGMVNWGFVVPQLRRMVLGADYSTQRLHRMVGNAVRALAESVATGPEPAS